MFFETDSKQGFSKVGHDRNLGVHEEQRVDIGAMSFKFETYNRYSRLDDEKQKRKS